MPIILKEDEGKVLGKRQVKVPDKIVDKLKLNRNLFANYSKAKGYKRINSIIDDDYNKRSNKKDKIHNNDKTVSFSDLKRIDFDLRHTPANKNNLDYVLQAPLKQWANDELKKLRTSVKKVKSVPPVPKLEKKPLTTPTAQKDIKMGNATIKLTESQLLMLKEYHNQLVFNSDEDGNVYFQKNNYENFIDFLEEIGTYGQLPPSEWSRRRIEQEIDYQLEKVSPDDSDLDESDYTDAFYSLISDAHFVYHTDDELFNENLMELMEKYKQFLEDKNLYDTEQSLEYFLTSNKIYIENEDEAYEYLTFLGQDEYDSKLNDSYKDHIYEHDLLDGLQINERGLIYMEREIAIPKATSPYMNKKTNTEYTGDYFKHLMNSYYGIGNCFTWGNGFGQSYCANSFGVGNTYITLKCWIDPKDVNWYETVQRNCYSLRYEREIYVDNSNAKIEVFEVIVNRVEYNNKTISNVNILKQPIIVNP